MQFHIRTVVFIFGLIFFQYAHANSESSLHNAFDNNGDGYADVLWRNQDSGLNWLWTMNGMSILESKGINTISLDWEIAGRGDLDGDGRSDIVWRNTVTGRNWAYLMNGTEILTSKHINYVADLNWKIKGVADFDGDGKADILWRHRQSGQTWIYLMDGFQRRISMAAKTVEDLNWQIVTTADVNGDGKSDVVWRHQTSGLNYIWLMDGASISQRYTLNTVPIDWKVSGSGDVDGDGTDDLIWRNVKDGRNWLYLMDKGQIGQSVYLNTVVDGQWQIRQVADFDADGNTDLLWRHHNTGQTYVYLMNGVTIESQGGAKQISQDWRIVAQQDTDHDGLVDSVDPDIDGDGVANGDDLFSFNEYESIDTDGDGLGDNADPDDDNNGVRDDEELRVELSGSHFTVYENESLSIGRIIFPEGGEQAVSDLSCTGDTNTGESNPLLFWLPTDDISISAREVSQDTVWNGSCRYQYNDQVVVKSFKVTVKDGVDISLLVDIPEPPALQNPDQIPEPVPGHREEASFIGLGTDTHLIIADGQSKAQLYVKVYDKYNREINDYDLKVVVNGQEQPDLSLTTTSTGEYDIYVQSGAAQSNSVVITAREDIEYPELSIPVVFHIGHFNEVVGTGNNLSQAAIQGAIARLNNAFANNTGSTNPNAVDMKITFRLAQYDREGLPMAEPGINRQDITPWDIGQNSGHEINNPTIPWGSAQDKELGIYEFYEWASDSFWDPREYKNIWISNMSDANFATWYKTVNEGDVIGIEQSPSDSPVKTQDYLQPYVDLLAIKPNRIHDYTITHEMGHALGLKHTFIYSYQSCEVTDYAPDTYSYIDGGAYTPCKSDNKGSLKQDSFMDYLGDRNTFTYDQRTRVRSVIEHGVWIRELIHSKK